MRGQPSWGFWNDEENQQHWNEEGALQNYRNSPCETTVVEREGVVNPVDEEDAKVQC
jgi:hypothetical protein